MREKSKKEKDKVIILDTDKLSPEQVTQKIEEIITSLTDYSFKKMVKQPATQMNLMKFLKWIKQDINILRYYII